MFQSPTWADQNSISDNLKHPGCCVTNAVLHPIKYSKIYIANPHNGQIPQGVVIINSIDKSK